MTNIIRKHKVWSSVIGVLVVLTAIGAIGSPKKTSTKATGTTASSSSPTPASTSSTPTLLTAPASSTPTVAPAAVTSTTVSTAAVPSRALYVAGSALTGTPPASGTCHARTPADGQPLPDVHCTPGAIDAAVTQANIHTTICVSGYTTKVRPSASQTDAFKAADEKAYSISSGELDHLVPLEIGGSSDARNLWVEPGTTPNPEDAVEDKLHAEVCAEQMTLAAAQLAIAIDWTVDYAGSAPAPTTAPPVAPTTAPAPQPTRTSFMLAVSVPRRARPE